MILKMNKIIEKDLSYKIMGLCFKVHKKIGRFAREKQYSNELELLFKQESVNYNKEYEIRNIKATSAKGNKVDFIVENKIIIDLKAKPFITKEDYYQMQRYLQAADFELGLIINFRAYKLVSKRILNSSHSGNLDKN
jgi:GxxExxY protein